MTDLDTALAETGEPMLKHFRYEHLPPVLQEESKPFAELAMRVARRMVKTAERTVTLRKLLEAKDAAVRCAIEGAG